MYDGARDDDFLKIHSDPNVQEITPRHPLTATANGERTEKKISDRKWCQDDAYSGAYARALHRPNWPVPPKVTAYWPPDVTHRDHAQSVTSGTATGTIKNSNSPKVAALRTSGGQAVCHRSPDKYKISPSYLSDAAFDSDDAGNTVSPTYASTVTPVSRDTIGRCEPGKGRELPKFWVPNSPSRKPSRQHAGVEPMDLDSRQTDASARMVSYSNEAGDRIEPWNVELDKEFGNPDLVQRYGDSKASTDTLTLADAPERSKPALDQYPGYANECWRNSRNSRDATGC
nr:Vp5-NS38 epitope splicing protein [synthetic construct]